MVSRFVRFSDPMLRGSCPMGYCRGQGRRARGISHKSGTHNEHHADEKIFYGEVVHGSLLCTMYSDPHFFLSLDHNLARPLGGHRRVCEFYCTSKN